MPPMTSTTRSALSSTSSNVPRERVSTPVSSGRSPVTCSTWSVRAARSSAKADPTVPWPRSPTLKVPGKEVLVGLAADDGTRFAVLDEDHGRARHAVVVVGHAEAVGPGGGRDDEVARPRVVEQHLVDDDVPGLAMLAGQATRRLAAEAPQDLGLVARPVEHRAHVVGHAAVDAHPRRDVALDRLDRVERHTGVRGQRAAGLVED